MIPLYVGLQVTNRYGTFFVGRYRGQWAAFLGTAPYYYMTASDKLGREYITDQWIATKAAKRVTVPHV